MKKILVFAVLIIISLCLIACNKTPEVSIADNVSYVETHLYAGEDTDFEVSITMGKKESSFVTDGTNGDMENFATLKLVPLRMELFDKTYTFHLVGEKGNMEGALEKDIFGVSYSFELQDIESIGELMNIKIMYDETEDTIELTNMLKDMIDWEDVLKIAENEFSDLIAEEMTEDNFPREIHIKYLTNNNIDNSPYYWYISFISADSDYWALLIDPMTGDVISKKS